MSHHPDPAENHYDYRKSRAESTATESDDSEMYEDSDSIFPDEEMSTSKSFCSSTMRRLETIYANFLYNLVYRDIFYTGLANYEGPSSLLYGPQSNTTLKGKRRLNHISQDRNIGCNNGDGPADDDGYPGPSRPSMTVRAQEITSPRRFACPFFKKHPEAFRSCGFSDNATPSRVKAHVNRKHKFPIYCPRCWVSFKSEIERDDHIRRNDCPISPRPEWICATSDQLQQLSKRTKYRTDKEEWDEIYSILFPGSPLPESPHLDATLSAEVNIIREAFLNAVPIATRKAIKQVIPGPTQSLYADDLERAMLSTHTEVFERVVNAIRSGHPGAYRQTSQRRP